jgi:hypothetical protein
LRSPDLFYFVRYYDLLKNSTGQSEFKVNTFGNFVVRDNETNRLSAAHGFRPPEFSDLGNSSSSKGLPEHRFKLESSQSVQHAAHNIINGSATARYERAFQSSNISIVGLIQVVLCCDTIAKGMSWLQKYKPNTPYEVVGSTRPKKRS